MPFHKPSARYGCGGGLDGRSGHDGGPPVGLGVDAPGPPLFAEEVWIRSRFRAGQPFHPHARVEPAQPRAGRVQPVAPAFHGRVVMRLGHRIGGDLIAGDGLRFRCCFQVGKRGESARVCATARKQEHGQQG